MTKALLIDYFEPLPLIGSNRESVTSGAHYLVI